MMNTTDIWGGLPPSSGGVRGPIIFKDRGSVWVLSSVDNLVGTADIVVFGHHPMDSEVMEFVGKLEQFLSYNEVKDKSATLRIEGSLSTVCRFYELNEMGVK